VIFDIERFTVACNRQHNQSQTAAEMANLQTRLIAVANLIQSGYAGNQGLLS
jgi:hypothetical protein